MSLKRLLGCIILINILCILPQVYGIKPIPQAKPSPGVNTFRIFSDRDGKNPVNEATTEDTVFINYRLPDLPNPSEQKLFICDTLIKGFSITDSSVLAIPLSMIVESIVKPDKPFKMITFGLGKDKPEVRSGKFKLVYQPYSIASSEKKKIGMARPGDQVWICSELNSDQLNQLVYINTYPVPIGKLMRDLTIPDKNVYYFILKNNISTHDSLGSLFNRENRKKVNVKVGIGSSFDTRKELSSPLIIVFDNYKGIRRIISILVSLVILILIGYIIKKNKLGLLQDTSTTSEKPCFSLSRSQMAFWTLIILIAYFFIWYETGAMIHITPQVLILLGISAGTTLSAHIIDNNAADQQAGTDPMDEESSGNFLLDILSEDQKRVSIHRVQNVAFTIAIGGYFLYEVFIHRVIPDLDTNLMILMGISSATYIAVKQGESKSSKDKPVS